MIDALLYGVQFAVSILGVVGVCLGAVVVLLWFMD